MDAKLKVALLAALGFSTAACCSTKKAAKGEDKKDANIEVNTSDPNIILMYGVPAPDSVVVMPVREEPAKAEIQPVPFPDGTPVKPISEEEAAERVKAMEEAEK